MSAESKPDLHLEIAHVLFIDVVGYSNLLVDEQTETLQLLNQIVRGMAEFRTAEEKGELIRLPTGDGMALVFLTKPEAPVQCALEISKAIKSYPELKLRMGIHSGSVSQVSDVNDRSNVTGAGINMAQRVMDCGDAGHILLSQRVAEDLAQYRQWQSRLHDLGECVVKHGVRVHVFNLYTDEVGNRDVPAKLKPIAQQPAAAAIVPSEGRSARNKHGLIAATILLLTALALGFGFWVASHRTAPKSQERSQSSPPPEGKPLDLPALAQKAKGAVVLIVGYDATGKVKTGSGFFVSADGRLVTNYHVIQGIVNATAKLETGAIYNIAGVLASSPALDLAVLKADARDMQFLLVDGESSPPQTGTRVAVIGSPLALEGSLSEGIVSANRSMEDGSWLQFSAPISPGSSGSPVLDRHGRVVGVATKIAKEGQNLNFARSSQDLWNFLQTIHQDAKPERLSEQDQILSDPAFIAAKEANGRGEGAAALKLLNALLQRYPSDPRLLFQFALAYETLGLHDQAYQSYRAYINIDPTDVAAWHNLAIVAGNLNKTDEATNACKQTLKMKQDAGTWRLLGDLYGKQGQSDLSTQAYAQAKALEERPVYVVTAPEGKGLNLRSDHGAKSPIVAKLQHGDRVFLEDGNIRNEDPPHPVTWQKVTTMNGVTGWIDFDYLAPSKDANQSTTPAVTMSPASPGSEDFDLIAARVNAFYEKYQTPNHASIEGQLRADYLSAGFQREMALEDSNPGMRHGDSYVLCDACAPNEIEPIRVVEVHLKGIDRAEAVTNRNLMIVSVVKENGKWLIDYIHFPFPRQASTPAVSESPPSTPAKALEERPVYVVTAPESKVLSLRSDHSAKSPIIQKLQHGDRVFLEDGNIRNEDPPHPTTWQKVTTMDGVTGWVDFDYIASQDLSKSVEKKDANQSTTPVVSESPASAPATEDAEVRRLFEKWLSVSNAGDTEQEASLYAEPADYLDFGSLTRQQLVQELQKDRERWPQQRYASLKPPLIDKTGDSEWRVAFEINFDVRDPSSHKQVTGTATLTWLVRKRTSGGVEIVSSKEEVTSRTRHDIKRGGR